MKTKTPQSPLRGVSHILLISFLIASIATMLPSVFAQSVSIIISPNVNTNINSIFYLNITTNNVTDMYGWSVTLDYRKAITMTSALAVTSFFNGSCSFSQTYLNYSHHRSFVYGYLMENISGVTGSGVVATMNFTAIYNGTANMKAYKSQIINSVGAEIAHTTSTPTVVVSGAPTQYFLCVQTPQYGSLNTTSGVYDNGTNVPIKATETTGTFQYIKVDGVIYTTKIVTITMNSDHNVSASFQIPTLTITTEPSADIWVGTSKKNSGTSGVLSLQKSYGTYTVKVSKIGFYSAVQNVTLDANKTLDFQLCEVRYAKNVPLSYKTITFTGTASYSNWSKTHVDFDGLIEVGVLEGTTGTISIIFHYDTDYPIVEVESQNCVYLKFDIAEVYSHYAQESYQQKAANTLFTGLQIDSNCNMTMEIQGIGKPRELWKTTPEGSTTKLANWQYAGNSLTVNFVAGDPTISLLFWSAAVVTVWTIVFPVIALIGFAMVFIKFRPESIHDIVVYAAAFIVIGVILPLALNMMVNG